MDTVHSVPDKRAGTPQGQLHDPANKQNIYNALVGAVGISLPTSRLFVTYLEPAVHGINTSLSFFLKVMTDKCK